VEHPVKQGTAPRASSAPPSGASLLDGIDFGSLHAEQRPEHRAAARRIDRSIVMSKKSRYTILAGAIIIIVGVVIYTATRGGGAQREQGLVGPKGPPPAKHAAPR
jgi:hypothetical protein